MPFYFEIKGGLSVEVAKDAARGCRSELGASASAAGPVQVTPPKDGAYYVAIPDTATADMFRRLLNYIHVDAVELDQLPDGKSIRTKVPAPTADELLDILRNRLRRTT